MHLNVLGSVHNAFKTRTQLYGKVWQGRSRRGRLKQKSIENNEKKIVRQLMSGFCLAVSEYKS